MNTALDDAAAAVSRAIRIGHVDDASEAAISLRGSGVRADTARIAFTRACENGGARPEHGRAIAEWLLGIMAGEPITAAPRDRWTPQAIRIEPGQLPHYIDCLEDALADARLGLYRRGGDLLHIGNDAEGDFRVVQVTEDRLIDLASCAAVFMRPNPSKHDPNRETPADCPRSYARGVLARGYHGSARLPQVAGVIRTPTLRPDGSLLDLPGFDPATGLFLDLSGLRMPPIPATPSIRDACAAVDKLDGLLTEFPFVGEEDRAVAFAALLTAVCRRAVNAAPLFAFTAPSPGTGKSYLVDLVNMLATGKPAAGISYSADVAENRKTLDAALLAGEPTIVLDNVSCELAGDRLNQMLTQPEISLRILGQTQNVSVPCGALVMANGNSLSIAADLTRRTMLCRLDAGVERPELRKFSGDPIGAVRSERGQYVAAALTILRAYQHAGCPDAPPPLAGFEDWSRLVRAALMWCEFADPCDSAEHVRANDPRRSDHLAVLECWNAAVGNARVGTRGIIDKASQSADFREALLAVAGERGAVNTRRLGLWLRSVRGKIVSGMKIESGGTVKGIATWRLLGGNVVPLRADDAATLDALPF